MSVYSELLRLTLLDGEDDTRCLPEIVAQVLSRRNDLSRDPVEGPASAHSVGQSLAYDAALVSLCHQMNVPEALSGGADVTQARRQAEIRLAAILPALQPFLEPSVSATSSSR